MAKITSQPKKKDGEREVIVVKTQSGPKKIEAQGYKWWLAQSKQELADQMLSTVSYLKQTQNYRVRQAALFARMYGNLPLFNFAGSSVQKSMSGNNMPADRPTMNVVQSCVDTLVSRISQSKPKPRFLTDNADYKERTLSKQMNSFINGELYQTDAYELGSLVLRDAAVLGTGCIKIFETPDHKVGLDRVLHTELLADPNDALYGKPRQLFHLKLVDKAVLMDVFPEAKKAIQGAEQGYVDDGALSTQTIADQIIIAEGWHLPSGKNSGDGRHSIVCTAGVIADEPYEKQRFPFVFQHYSPRLTGMWGQGLAEQLMGTQSEINKILITISKSIHMVGVPRIFVETGSKVLKTALNNEIGSIIYYSGTRPEYSVAPCVPGELYQQLERLVQGAYQQSGISALAATSQKPAGLNSGEAIRSYDDLQSDRFAALDRRYQNYYIDSAYQIIDCAAEICEEQGSYSTVYPNKNGTKEIDLPKAAMLRDEFVIQCFDESSLPRDPAGRLQSVIERVQAGMITIQEGRRLLDYPDLEQVEKLANSGEERILQYLDEIVEEGKYSPPDPFMDLDLAQQLVTQYYNLYVAAKLEENKAQMLRDFFTQIQAMKTEMMAPPPGGAPMPGGQPGSPAGQPAPQAVPQPPPVSDLIPNAPQ